MGCPMRDDGDELAVSMCPYKAISKQFQLLGLKNLKPQTPNKKPSLSMTLQVEPSARHSADPESSLDPCALRL